MAKTIASAFSQLKANLEITGLQTATVSARQKHIREAMADEFDILSSFLSGSYSRATMIAPLKRSDVDIFFVLHSKYFEKYAPAQLLDRVRTVLLRTYSQTPKISRNGQAVTITFTDFNVDVVPGFNRRGGGYLIPDSIEGKWIPTDPKVHDTTLSAADKTHGGDLVPLVKMLKGWNRGINDGFVGFYLELLAKKVLTNVTISDLSSGVRFVLDKGRDEVQYQITDPAGYGSHIDPLANVSTVEDAVTRFNTACNRARKAERFAESGKIPAAFEEWRKIFPNYFPKYG